MIKRIICLAFSLILLIVSFAGCSSGGEEPKKASKMEIEDVNVYYFDRFGNEVMPIGGYIGPTSGFGYDGNYMPSQITDYHYGLVSDCGLNFIVGMKPDYKTNKQDVLDSLYYADKHNVMYFVRDSYLFSVTEDNAANSENYLFVSTSEFKERVKEYWSYPSFAGLVCRDEPWYSMFPQISKILEVFDSTFDNNKLLYVNSLSYQCPGGWFGSGPTGKTNTDMTVEGYMDAWFDTFKTLGYYSYDTYPFISAGDNIRGDILQNYSLVRQYSDRYNVPFWTFMQAGGNWGGDTNWRVTNRGEILWQVSTSLAFGAKGYTWFPYNTPPENVGSPEGDDGLIGRAGQKTPQWYYAQEANKQTQACDHILMKSKYKGIMYHFSGEADSTNRVSIPEAEVLQSFKQLKSITGDNAIVGCFNYMGRTALYVVNNSITRDKAKITLHFDDCYKYQVIQRAKSTNLTGKDLTFTFAPGEGACVVLK